MAKKTATDSEPKASAPKTAASKTAAPKAPPAAKAAAAPKAAKPKQAVATHLASDQAPRGRRIEVVGEVVSDKMHKTISVLIYRLVRHKKYGKFMRRTSVFKAHDEKNVAKIGDTVRLLHVRPLSKTKRWTLAEVVQKAQQTGAIE